jgi:hypothetical protein
MSMFYLPERWRLERTVSLPVEASTEESVLKEESNVITLIFCKGMFYLQRFQLADAIQREAWFILEMKGWGWRS